jgi:putative transposase
MTRKRHTEEQIIAVLQDAQGGASVQDLCGKHGISDAAFISDGRNTPAWKSAT